MSRSNVRKGSNWILLKIFIKSNNLKFIFLILNTIFIFLILNAFFILWYSKQNSMLQKYFSNQKDWNDDLDINAYYSTISSNFTQGFEHDYLEKVTSELTDTLNYFIPSLASNCTSLFSVEFLHRNQSLLQRFQVNGYLASLSNVFYESLIEGRLPNNSTELLYYQISTLNPTYHINDTLSLQSDSSQNAFTMNFTIVGILSNLERSFRENSLSTDVLNWTSNIKYWRYKYTPQERFFTTSSFLVDIANSFPFLSTGRAVIIDFDYNTKAIRAVKISKCLSYFQEHLFTFQGLLSEPRETFTIGLDLYESLRTFQSNWRSKTIIVLAAIFPLSLLLIFVCYEGFNYHQKEYLASLSLLQTLGVNKKRLSWLVFIEVIGILFFSSIVGSFCSLLISLIVSLSDPNGYQDAFSFLTAPLFLFVMFSFLILYFLLGLIIELRKVRTLPAIKSLSLVNYQKNRFQQLFSKVELLLSFPGIILTSLGIFILKFTAEEILMTYWSLYTLGWVMIFFGVVMLTLAAFFLFSRCIVFTFEWFGEKLWRRRKNLSGFSFKNIKFNNKSYKKAISFLLLFGLALIPGIVLKPSLSDHLTIEKTLALGASDLVLNSQYPQLLPSQEALSNISGIEKTASVMLSSFTLKRDTFFGEQEYTVPILCIYNLTAFLATVELSTLNFGINPGEISQLEQNLSYLMTKDYAKRKGYSDGVRFTNAFFGEVSKEITFTFIAGFDVFPLLPQRKRVAFNGERIAFSLVMSLDSYEKLETSLISFKTSKSFHIIIKTTSSESLSTTKEQIQNQLSPAVEIVDQSMIINEMDLESINLITIFQAFSTIASSIIAVLYLNIIVANIFKFRTKALEIEYTLGITKKEIQKAFLLELGIISFIPIIFCSFCGFIFGWLIGTFLSSNYQVYSSFKLSFNAYSVLAIILVGGLIALGWLTRLIPKIKQYHMVSEV